MEFCSPPMFTHLEFSYTEPSGSTGASLPLADCRGGLTALQSFPLEGGPSGDARVEIHQLIQCRSLIIPNGLGMRLRLELESPTSC